MFRNNSQFNMIFIVMLILVAITSNHFDLEATLLTLPGLICALTFHEYAHAKMSDKLGDPTPQLQGRLTLNPFAHLDPVGTFFLVFAGFGWGKPVQIDERYYRNPTRDTMLVALAGPVSNFIQAVVWFFIYGAMFTFGNLESNLWVTFMYVVFYAGLINLSLGVFNLLPLPPLDGSKILRYFLHGKAREFLYTLERYSTIILLILFWTDLTSILISPIIEGLANVILWLVDYFYALF